MSICSASRDSKSSKPIPTTAATFTPSSSQAIAPPSLDGQQHEDAASLAYQTDIDCAFCTFIGRRLSCCQTQRSPHSCPHCTALSQHFTRQNETHADEVAAPGAKLRVLEDETPEQRSNRLCVEKNKKIDGLKTEVEKMNKEEESLRAENEALEKKLKMLEAEIKTLQPAAEFTVKEEKKKGKKK